MRVADGLEDALKVEPAVCRVGGLENLGLERPDRRLDLQRVLETVCDTHEVEERDGGAWVELSKRIASAETAA